MLGTGPSTWKNLCTVVREILVRPWPVRSANAVLLSPAATRALSTRRRNSSKACFGVICLSTDITRPPAVVCSVLHHIVQHRSQWTRANTDFGTVSSVGVPADQTTEEYVNSPATILLTTALTIVVAVLVAAGAAKLARMDDASYPTALTRAAVAFTATLTLAAATATVLAAYR
jgi:hypothetical protein